MFPPYHLPGRTYLVRKSHPNISIHWLFKNSLLISSSSGLHIWLTTEDPCLNSKADTDPFWTCIRKGMRPERSAKSNMQSYSLWIREKPKAVRLNPPLINYPATGPGCSGLPMNWIEFGVVCEYKDLNIVGYSSVPQNNKRQTCSLSQWAQASQFILSQSPID